SVRTTDMSNFAIYYTTDHGDTWETISNKDLYSVNAFHTYFEFQEEIAMAYINTTDLGLLKVNIDLTSVGITDPDSPSQKALNLYPNPVMDYLTVRSDEKINTVSVYDLSGKLIISTETNVVDLSLLKQGFYLVQIKTITGKLFTEKIIRN
ncbi:MAG TPA: T9SS type A sorting domain-containing protein, partial [Bacteroidales bacterium]|nr:T9SS type A sorting domain-containing protein [Bacteroidales bacterium]